MSLLSTVIIAAFEKELEAASPEIEAYVMQAMGTLGAELMAYVTQKVVAAKPPVAPVTPVQTPQSVE